MKSIYSRLDKITESVVRHRNDAYISIVRYFVVYLVYGLLIYSTKIF